MLRIHHGDLSAFVDDATAAFLAIA